MLRRPTGWILWLLFATAFAPGGASAFPVISEVFYDAVGSDDGRSFVELYGEPGTPLDGMRLEGVNGAGGAIGPVLALSGAIPADGFFVVADDLAGGPTLVASADLVLGFDFQNGPDSIVLVAADAVLDAVGYGEFAPDEIFAGEGAPAPDAPADASLARFFADLDTDDNAADFGVLAAPTPGSGPLAPVPEPATACLVFAGLAGLGACGRRPRRAQAPARRVQGARAAPLAG
jgi:hypothetical protein